MTGGGGGGGRASAPEEGVAQRPGPPPSRRGGTGTGVASHSCSWRSHVQNCSGKVSCGPGSRPLSSFERKSRLIITASGGLPRRKASSGKMALYTPPWRGAVAARVGKGVGRGREEAGEKQRPENKSEWPGRASAPAEPPPARRSCPQPQRPGGSSVPARRRGRAARWWFRSYLPFPCFDGMQSAPSGPLDMSS